MKTPSVRAKSVGSAAPAQKKTVTKPSRTAGRTKPVKKITKAAVRDPWDAAMDVPENQEFFLKLTQQARQEYNEGKTLEGGFGRK